MPYINRYFHKKDAVVPSRPIFQVTSLSQEDGHNQKIVPRYVSAYAYVVQDKDSTNREMTQKGNRYTSVATSSIVNKPYDLGHSMILQRYDEGSSLRMNLRAKIKAPSGTIQFCDVLDFDKNHFNIQFIPTEIGEHTVSVKSGNFHVQGSPFKFMVENLESSVGFKNVKVFGKALFSGYTNENSEFSISSREAGSGHLSVSIDGPSKAVINMVDKKDNTYVVRYNIPFKGDYQCSIKFNNEHIQGSPFGMVIVDREDEGYSQKDTLLSTKNHGIVVGKTSIFTIKHCGFKGGLMRAFVITPSKKEESVKINHLGNDHFSLQLDPHEGGLHYIHVLLDEKPISGSPFSVMVLEVYAYEDEDTENPILETNQSMIEKNPSEGGQQMTPFDGLGRQDSYELDNGSEFIYVPTIKGEYIISSKHGDGSALKGSIFKMNMISDSAKNEASSFLSLALKSYPENIKCYGEGLHKAYYGRKNQFLVDTSSGGTGALSVAIAGPTKPCEKVKMKHIREHRFKVKYVVQEHGDHDIVVRWGEDQIPYSPFRVAVQ